jgi:hypothetical protein
VNSSSREIDIEIVKFLGNGVLAMKNKDGHNTLDVYQKYANETDPEIIEFIKNHSDNDRWMRYPRSKSN